MQSVFLTLICTCCGISFDPPQGEECYGKCQECLSVHFNSFARLHVPDLVSFFVDALPSPLHVVPPLPSLQVAQPPGPDTGIGSPPGDSPAPVVSPDGGAAASNSNMNSNMFLALAPQLICRRCGVTFRPQIGVECDSMCDVCRAPGFLLPPPKRLRIVGKTNPHRKAGPPL